MPLQCLAAIILLATLQTPSATLAKEPSMRRIASFDNAPGEPRWMALNDGVMGGRSSGSPKVAEGLLEFRGDLSLANNGGFSSVRTVGSGFDLTGVSAVVLRVRGDGRRYQLRLATDLAYRGIAVSFGAGFDTKEGTWTVVRVPLDSLEATVRGTAIRGASLEPSQVRAIGLLIADKREGPFALSVDWIAVG